MRDPLPYITRRTGEVLRRQAPQVLIGHTAPDSFRVLFTAACHLCKGREIFIGATTRIAVEQLYAHFTEEHVHS